jgi:hypothetical protein
MTAAQILLRKIKKPQFSTFTGQPTVWANNSLFRRIKINAAMRNFASRPEKSL